ncbi:hypothetical protein KDL01_26840 [Actinospica durhamensis]|uniref:AAA family ATPase n=2 Tax=Actinospica durhamensis TaxID=1508375 RepID=A0A941IR30_9ACTN|nr:hypothetical protein [Actinospica durhamensis]MBR7836924.1 hypothetical protein [Actinospica durhamensis]
MTFNFRDKPADRADFANVYMEHLAERGIEVIAVADHHTAAWLEVMRAAGDRAGIAVFPGVEVTTGSGSDGVHLVLIGDLDRCERDIDLLLAKVCGFDDNDHPRFDPLTGDPAPSPRSAVDILSDLDDNWFALAPHALGDNGIASGKTLRGTLKWKALHHERLAALDPGGSGCGSKAQKPEKPSADKDSHNAKFRSRRLDDYPCLKRLAFIHTSDGYSLDKIGSRFSWIRMATPSLEALRQASLDFEARILADSDARLAASSNPNLVQHPWIEGLTIQGTIGNSGEPLTLSLEPRLNVIIGGRGAGKSTVVAAIRHLYGKLEDLPEAVAVDARQFSRQVFGEAEIRGQHHLPISRDLQEAVWTHGTGSRTVRGGQALPTAYAVRVFNQKELYERTTSDRNDPQAASRYLLKLVDDALRLEEGSHDHPAGWSAQLKTAENSCRAAVSVVKELQALAEREPELKARKAELERQVDAFGDPASQKERQRNEQVVNHHQALAHRTAELLDAIPALEQSATARLTGVDLAGYATDEHPALVEHYTRLQAIRSTLVSAMSAALAEARTEIETARTAQQAGSWSSEVEHAEDEILSFQARLAQLGIDPTMYLQLRDDLGNTEKALADTRNRLKALGDRQRDEQAAWAALDQLYVWRRSQRSRLINEIQQKSGSLRFVTGEHRNADGWVREVRALLNLRGETFGEEVAAVAAWLWNSSDTELPARLALWRSALTTNAYQDIEAAVHCHAKWWKRLRETDEAVRIRLATLLADDTVTMYFLRSGRDITDESAWQPVTTGSAGQRSAAMLSFVLNYGTEPLILDQPEDDLDTALITNLIVPEIRKSRWDRQVIIVTHNANIPVNGDAEQVIVMDNDGTSIHIRDSADETDATRRIVHAGPIEIDPVREDIQEILEGGKDAFRARERRYNNDLSTYREARREMMARGR